MPENPDPCHTCRYHEGVYRNCYCLICLSPMHQQRCVEDRRGPCVIYKPK